MSTLTDRLAQVARRAEQVESQLAAQETYGDLEKLRRLNREQKELAPVMQVYSLYTKREQELSDALALMDDPDLRPLAQEEYARVKAELTALERELQLLLLPRDPDDEKSVVVEIRAGVGGEEAALFAHSLFRMYSMYADRHGWTLEVVSENATELGGIKEISFTIEGADVYSRMKYESGVHRVQRVPETESGGRIHTSTATVAVLPEADEVSVEIDPADLEMQVFRSSGAGGQKVNKTSSAVRLIHKATGIVVSSQVERSHFQNLENCKQMLRAKLAEIKEREHLEKISDIKGVQMKIDFGSAIRSYVFMPYTLAKDARTAFENSNINAVMDGDIDGFINAYLAMKAEK